MSVIHPFSIHRQSSEPNELKLALPQEQEDETSSYQSTYQLPINHALGSLITSGFGFAVASLGSYPFNGNGKKVAIVAAGGACAGLNSLVKHSAEGLMKEGYRIVYPEGGARAFATEGAGLKTLRPSALGQFDEARGALWPIGINRAPKTDEAVKAMIRNARRENVDVLYVIGGGGGSHLAHLLHQEVAQAGLQMQVVFVPKTLDGNLHRRRTFIHRTDGTTYTQDRRLMTVGHESSVAQAAQLIEAFSKNLNSGEVGFFEANGREAGQLARAIAVRSGVEHYVTAEHQTTLAELEHMTRQVHQKGGGVVIVAEGVEGLRDHQTGQFVKMSDLNSVPSKVSLAQVIENAFMADNISQVEARVMDLTPALASSKESVGLARQAVDNLLVSGLSQSRVNILQVTDAVFDRLKTQPQAGVLYLEGSVEAAGLAARAKAEKFNLIVVSPSIQINDSHFLQESPSHDHRGVERKQSVRVGQRLAEHTSISWNIPTRSMTGTHLLIAAPTTTFDQRLARRTAKEGVRAIVEGLSGVGVAARLVDGQFERIPLGPKSWVDVSTDAARIRVETEADIRSRIGQARSRVYSLSDGHDARMAQLMQAQHGGQLFVGIASNDYHRLTITPEWQIAGQPVSFVRPGSDLAKEVMNRSEALFIGDDAGSMKALLGRQGPLGQAEVLQKPRDIILHAKYFEEDLTTKRHTLERHLQAVGRSEHTHLVSVGGWTSEEPIREWTPENKSKINMAIASRDAYAVARTVWRFTGKTIDLDTVQKGQWNKVTTDRGTFQYAIGERFQDIIDYAGPWKNIGVFQTGYQAGQISWRLFGAKRSHYLKDFSKAHADVKKNVQEQMITRVSEGVGLHFDSKDLPRAIMTDNFRCSQIDATALYQKWQEVMEPALLTRAIRSRELDTLKLREGFRQLLKASVSEFGTRHNRAGLAYSWAEQLTIEGVIAHPREAFHETNWQEIWKLGGAMSLRQMHQQRKTKGLTVDLKHLAYNTRAIQGPTKVQRTLGGLSFFAGEYGSELILGAATGKWEHFNQLSLKTVGIDLGLLSLGGGLGQELVRRYALTGFLTRLVPLTSALVFTSTAHGFLNDQEIQLEGLHWSILHILAASKITHHLVRLAFQTSALRFVSWSHPLAIATSFVAAPIVEFTLMKLMGKAQERLV